MALLQNIKTYFSRDPSEDSAKVSLSSSGQLSVDLADLVKTKQFRKDLEITKKIAELAGK